MLDVQRLRLRAAFFRLIRSFFHDQGFLEVDTPIRQPVYIPESNIVPIESEGQYLQTSPELCMKRLLAAGSGDIFQICRCFRKEEQGRLHLEEFQMLEWYRVDADYTQLMDDCEALFRFLSKGLRKMASTDFAGENQFFSDVKLSGRWPRITVAQAFELYSPFGLAQAMRKDKFDEVLVEFIEPKLGFDKPVFLCDYPVEFGALARTKPDRPDIAERFELYINGIELANGFSEQADAGEQRARFVEEISIIYKRESRFVAMPERFIDELEFLGIAGGIALGLDRLLMIIQDHNDIAQTVTFNQKDFL